MNFYSRTTNVAEILGTSKIAGNAFTAFVASRIVAAIYTLRFGNGPFNELLCQQFD